MFLISYQVLKERGMILSMQPVFQNYSRYTLKKSLKLLIQFFIFITNLIRHSTMMFIKLTYQNNTYKQIPYMRPNSSIKLSSAENLSTQKLRTDEISAKQMQAHKQKLQAIFNRLNNQADKKQHIESWIFESIAIRKNFQGVKFRIYWKDKQSGYKVKLKLCTPREIGGKKINLDSYSIEIEDSNILVEKNQNLLYKQLQHYLDISIQDMLGHNKDVYSLSDEMWIRRLLPKIGVILREKLKGKAKVSSKIELIGLKKEKINQKYMLTPPCSNFSWHPKGFIFLVQNQVSTYFESSLFGNKKMISKIFPAPKIEKQLSFDHMQSVEINFENPYYWNITETFDFLDRRYEQIEELDINPRMSISDHKFSRSFSMAYRPVSQISVVVNNDSKDLIEGKSLNLTGNLKLYRISNQLSMIEQEMKQLTAEFSKHRGRSSSVLQILLSPLCKNYQNLVSEKILGPFQIKIIEQLFKSTLKQNNFSIYLKAIIAETQCNHSLIINALNTILIQLGAPAKYQDKMWLFYSYFVTFNDFDQYEFQDIFFMIIELYLEKLRSLQTVRMEITNSSITDPFFIQSKSSVFLPQIQYKKFVSDPIYQQMMRKFLPLYEIRMKNSVYIQYNRIMRILSANQRMRNSVNIFNQFVNDKQLMKSIQGLEYFIKEYMIEKMHLKESRHNRKKRRSWKIQCLRCKQSTTTNEVLQEKYSCLNCKHS